uniref:Ig-like domain-containing protein n=1 Tax=Varanus komodoensis TaxID=61221 RepID=A0A8D2KSD9_VARKO
QAGSGLRMACFHAVSFLPHGFWHQERWILHRKTCNSLSAHPPGPLYRPGETVTLQCLAPRDAPGMRFEFSLLREGLTYEETPPHDGSTQFTFTASKETSGFYSCRYSKSDTERSFESSIPVKFYVAGADSSMWRNATSPGSLPPGARRWTSQVSLLRVGKPRWGWRSPYQQGPGNAADEYPTIHLFAS